ncbi:MAG: 2-C-methyl-D-erythritol 2,4-cyclodiphosphate synthase [Clostridia bacterium]|nr:2-C-methyl-D-erythritol 2,4-cyclodiphosphate synthase [Clostridia bacterium]
MSIKVCVIIAAAGSGRRMGGLNKIVQPVGGRPVLTWSLALFEQSPAVDEIIIAAAEEQVELLRALAAPYGKVTAVVAGGNSRAASVSRALAAASSRVSHIAVHDAARPLLSSADWQALLAAAAKAPGGVILAARPSDSVKSIGEDGYLKEALDRNSLLLAQTPQIFPAALLREAYAMDSATLESATDEAALVAKTGARIRYLQAAEPNFKLTFAADLALAEAELRRRGCLMADSPFDSLPAMPAFGQTALDAPAGCKLTEDGLRIGWGWDIHRLAAGRPLLLGGVAIPHHVGLLGHSDADVLLHALIDALLGAAALGDIGSHFPDNDPRFRGADSRLLLRQTHELLTKAGWRIINIDATVIAEQPRLQPYRQLMRESVAAELQLAPQAISIKAKTAEGLGEIGRQEAIAAQALALIRG